MDESSERTAIRQVADRLQGTYPGVPADTVRTVVDHNDAKFKGRPIRDFVPLFVERGARQELGDFGA